MNAAALLEKYIESYGEELPKTAVNWSSENSDISFIWTYYFLGMADIWRATKDPRALKMCVDGIEWVMGMTDIALGKDHKADVIVSWNPKKTEKRSIGSHGYGASPSAELNPGWTRYITFDGDKKGFRPEILASGHIGYAIACFIQDAENEIEVPLYRDWLETLAKIFAYHDPNWRDEMAHHSGALFHTKEVAGYWWPKAVGAKVWKMQPGLNQQAQFLCMGVVVQELLQRDIGAKAKLEMYCKRTLSCLMLGDNKCRIALRYDFRDHSKMSKAQAEPTSDSTHTQKAMPLFLHALRLGYLPKTYAAGIIKQLRDVTYLGNGQMGILMDGSTDHGGPKGDDYHPDSAHLADAMLLPGGKGNLLGIAKEVYANEYKNPTSDHKAFHYAARIALVEVMEAPGINAPPAPVVDSKPDEKPKAKPPKKKEKHNDQAEKCTEPTPTEPLFINGPGSSGVLPHSYGCGNIDHMGDPANGDDPGIVSCTVHHPCIGLRGLRAGITHIIWTDKKKPDGKGGDRYITKVTVR